MRATKGFSFAGQPTREAMFTPPRKQPVFKLWNVVVLLVFIGLVGIIFTQHNTLKKLRDGKAGDKLGVVQKGSSRTLNKADDESDMNKKPWSCPEEMPANLVDQYTMNKQIDVVLWYKCQTGPQYDKEHRYSDELVEEQISRVEKRLVNFYGETDSMLYRSLDAFPITGKEVVIMGSQRPIYESVCIVFGGSSCTTIDFQPIIVSHPKLKTLTIAQYDANPTQFDAAISISSFEHDGLGRYGDPIRPDGDLDMMKKMKCIVKDDGILYLSVPIARDKIVWNMHRVYGRVRLPKLIEHWTLLEVFANWEMTRRWSGCDSHKEGDYQPILVLKNVEPEPGHNEKVLNKYLDDATEEERAKSCFGN